MKRPLSDFATEPVFTIRAVELRTGIAEYTLRAWEQRYGIVTPARSRSGKRLYSERDVALLQWVREQMLSGLNIGQVAALLERARHNNETIWVNSPLEAKRVPSAQESPPLASEWAAPLYHALVSLDDTHASQILEQATSIYSVAAISTEIIGQAWQALDKARERGEVLAVQARFGGTFLRGYLQSLLRTLPQQQAVPYLIIGCAPGESREADALILAVLACQQGYRVIYLGPDVQVEDLAGFTKRGAHPAMVILTTSRRESALALAEAQAAIHRASRQHTEFGYSGRVFDHDPGLRGQIAGIYLGPGPDQALTVLRAIISSGG